MYRDDISNVLSARHIEAQQTTGPRLDPSPSLELETMPA
ncbi:uncharacterized protein METZ01_LOCUS201027, partial [marine metagenome]